MNKFKQHVPTFIEGIVPFELEFSTTEELLSNEWVHGWSRYKHFMGFAISENYCLMAVLENGKTWYVLGYIENTKSLNLPRFEIKDNKAVLIAKGE